MTLLMFPYCLVGDLEEISILMPALRNFTLILTSERDTLVTLSDLELTDRGYLLGKDRGTNTC